MVLWGAAFLALAFAGPPAGGADEEVVQLAQLSVRQQIIVRVPARPSGRPAHRDPVIWKEGKGRKCVAAREIAGATMLGPDSVDLVLRDNSRVRARLENSCPALDYYHGFYISPNADGKICADRDTIRSRMGGTCRIERFRALKAERPD